MGYLRKTNINWCDKQCTFDYFYIYCIRTTGSSKAELSFTEKITQTIQGLATY